MQFLLSMDELFAILICKSIHSWNAFCRNSLDDGFQRTGKSIFGQSIPKWMNFKILAGLDLLKVNFLVPAELDFDLC